MTDKNVKTIYDIRGLGLSTYNDEEMKEMFDSLTKLSIEQIRALDKVTMADAYLLSEAIYTAIDFRDMTPELEAAIDNYKAVLSQCLEEL